MLCLGLLVRSDRSAIAAFINDFPFKTDNK